MEILSTSLLLDFFYFILIFHVYEYLPACLCTGKELWKWSPGNEATDGFQLLCGCWETNPGHGILTLACGVTPAKPPPHDMGQDGKQSNAPSRKPTVGQLGTIVISLWWGHMAQPLATWVRWGDPQAGLGLLTPGSDEKTWVHLVPCNTSQKAAIRVSRGKV